MKNNLMCHLIAGFPDMEKSFEVAEILAEAGSKYLEVQFPFSDPTADGPDIQAACAKALEGGFKVAEGFALVKKIVEICKVPVFIMSYATIACRNGLDVFIDKALSAGASGLIIPDLLPPDDEDLYRIAREKGMPVVPVFPISAKKERIDIIKNLKSEYMYVALRKGITGKKTEISSEQTYFLKELAKTGSKIMAGFGIKEKEQAAALQPYVDAAIIGSELVRVIASGGENFREALKEKINNLI